MISALRKVCYITSINKKQIKQTTQKAREKSTKKTKRMQKESVKLKKELKILNWIIFQNFTMNSDSAGVSFSKLYFPRKLSISCRCLNLFVYSYTKQFMIFLKNFLCSGDYFPIFVYLCIYAVFFFFQVSYRLFY